ncbi:hypothetical protein L1987_53620 [Smallanthus sonchifolius]|uniref:Uncharacterized protein n=1 Tax=Smallanthus sonchifolius TaxID=185202 RepID=A0ACB9EW43_9ASTR|nr:hypothetical protein L1987_53620 [Smallanthus sonchifolius]
MDLFAAGTDTTSTAIEWAISELIRHPRVMKKLQKELREKGHGKPMITEDDLEKMTYLQGVLKETLRLHIPLPLLIARESTQYVKLMGYDINAGCPAIQFAVVVIELALANLVYKYDLALQEEDLFAAGTDTTSTAIEWAISELIRHPRVMKKLQKELREKGHGKPMITEDDLEKMTYLQGVLKETLRLHTPLPLLIARESTQYVKLMGYDINAGTQVIINAWAIGRDPSRWEEPENFRPQRRGCPAIQFAVVVIELALANLVYKYDLALQEEDLFAAGTDTTSTAIEWAISELIRHPRVMKKLQKELREKGHGKPMITEDDLEKMTYLQGVLKETLRLHTPLPLLIARESTQYVKLMGYDINAGRQVIINAWAIGRDPSRWEEPENFRPERFLNSSID